MRMNAPRIKAPKISTPKAPAITMEHGDGMMTISLPGGKKIIAKFGDSRDGFNHFATLYDHGFPEETVKIHYINRTWERYEFQSVLQKLVEKTGKLSDTEKANLEEYLKGDLTNWAPFKQAASLAMLGDILGSTPEQKNKLKTMALQSSLPGLEIPEEWASLPEEEKAKRLNKVVEMVGQVGKEKGA